MFLSIKTTINITFLSILYILNSFWTLFAFFYISLSQIMHLLEGTFFVQFFFLYKFTYILNSKRFFRSFAPKESSSVKIFRFSTPHRHTKKPPSPTLKVVKNSGLLRDQGFEPWTPWLRVRCSANWANRAYYNAYKRTARSMSIHNASDIISYFSEKCKYFPKFLFASSMLVSIRFYFV